MHFNLRFPPFQFELLSSFLGCACVGFCGTKVLLNLVNQLTLINSILDGQAMKRMISSAQNQMMQPLSMIKNIPMGASSSRTNVRLPIVYNR